MMGTFAKIEALKTPGEQPQNERFNTQPAVAPEYIAAPAPAIAPSVADSATREGKLKELKRLNDAGLISQEVFLERQRKILE